MHQIITLYQYADNYMAYLCRFVIIIVHRVSYGTNVVVVNNQSENSKKFLLPFDWMFTTTTFVPWDILWTMLITHR